MKIKITIENFTISTKLSKTIQVKDLLRQIKNSKIINSNGDEFKLLDDSYTILDESDYIKVSEKLENKIDKNADAPPNSFLVNSTSNNSKSGINSNNDYNNLHNSNSINNHDNLNINTTLNNFEKPEEYLRFYLVKYPKLRNQKYSEPEEFWALSSAKPSTNASKKIEIECLIMKTTDAKTKIDTSKFKHPERSSAERLNLIDELINSSLGNIMGEIPNAPLRGNISQGTQNVTQLLNILRPIIGNDMSEGEVIINSSNRGPGSIIINRAGGSRRVAPDENSVNSLKEMGFPEEQCRRALVMARNNISVATDLLLSGDMDYLPSENQHQNHAQSNNANDNANNRNPNQTDSNNNNNDNQANQVSDFSNQDDEYMQNDYVEGESIGDEEMSDIPENISSSISFQNFPNLEVYINNFISNNNNNQQQQNSENSNSTNSNNNSNSNSNSNNNENNNNNNENSNSNTNNNRNQAS